MRTLFVVMNRTETAWFSHVDQVNDRVLWTRKRQFATVLGAYAAKGIAKKFGGVVKPAMDDRRSDSPKSEP